MKNTFLFLFGLAVAVSSIGEAQAANGLPKVDFQIGQIYPLGQGLAIPVKNGGFVRSPGTTVSVAIYDGQSRQLLMTKILSVAAMQPNQSRRVIVVPPSNAQSVVVKATIDPGNRVQETNENNNMTSSRH
ncbi:CARDB domain-containing protein [Aeoliella sp.]|uniref:CARDB domain-containing protein n=1 Tax=Aeoliella sp. TaxID=2795800 RepID=UPI003CCC2539